MKKSRGFTLIELMITIAIMSIVMAIAMPNMSKFIVKQRIQSQADSLLIALVYARTEALKNNKTVYVIPAGNTADDWQKKGWCVVLENDNNTNDSCDSNSENVLRVFEANKNIKITTPYSTVGALKLNFTAQGNLGAPSNRFKIYSADLNETERDASLRCIEINRQGRAKTERHTPEATGKCKV